MVGGTNPPVYADAGSVKSEPCSSSPCQTGMAGEYAGESPLADHATGLNDLRPCEVMDPGRGECSISDCRCDGVPAYVERNGDPGTLKSSVLWVESIGNLSGKPGVLGADPRFKFCSPYGLCCPEPKFSLECKAYIGGGATLAIIALGKCINGSGLLTKNCTMKGTSSLNCLVTRRPNAAP